MSLPAHLGFEVARVEPAPKLSYAVRRRQAQIARGLPPAPAPTSSLVPLFDVPREAYRHVRCPVCGATLRQPPGDTYVMQRQGWVKIGKSKHPEVRLKELRSVGRQRYIITPQEMDLTEPIFLAHVIPGDHEHALHQRFADDHVIGEWFLPGPALRTWLTRPVV